MSVQLYKHDRIDLATNAIRLIRVLRGSYSSPICCELIQCFLDRDCGVPYEALSYTWGDLSVPKVPINIVNKSDGTMSILMVLPTLHEILRHLRYSTQDRLLWVDAICIDQGQETPSMRERTHQVEQMRLVYEMAERVVVWLGHLDEDIADLMKFANDLDGRAMANATRAFSTNAWKTQYTLQIALGEFHGDKVQTARHTSAMENLLGRPWFRRIWIIQEVASARNGIVMCGTDWASMGMPLRTFALLPSLMELQVPEYAEAILDVMPRVYQQRKGWWNETRDLRTLLSKFRGSEASDPLDKVYALLGMASDEEVRQNIRPVYGIAAEKVFRDILAYVLFPSGTGSDICQLPSDQDLWLSVVGDQTLLASRIFEWSVTHGHQTTAMKILRDPTMRMINICPATIAKAGFTGLLAATLTARDFRPHLGRNLIVNACIHDKNVCHYNGCLSTVPINNTGSIEVRVQHDLGLFLRSPAISIGVVEAILLILLLELRDIPLDMSLSDLATHALCVAIEKKDTSMLSAILMHASVDVNRTRGPQGPSPLSLAASTQNEDIIMMLLLHEALTLSGASEKGTLLHEAARLGHTEVFRHLLSHASRGIIDINAEDSDGNTALELAVRGNQSHIVSLLLRHKDVVVDLPSGHGKDSVLWTSVSKSNVNIAHLLLKHGATSSIETKGKQAFRTGREDDLYPDGFEVTPLWQAIRRGDVRMLDLLLSYKADLNALGRTVLSSLLWKYDTAMEMTELHTPLEEAAFIGADPAIIKKLLEHGAGADLVNLARAKKIAWKCKRGAVFDILDQWKGMEATDRLKYLTLV